MPSIKEYQRRLYAGIGKTVKKSICGHRTENVYDVSHFFITLYKMYINNDNTAFAAESDTERT